MILDQIFENKIGFGKAQVIPLIILGLVDLNDGAQLVLSSFLTPIIKTEWQLTDQQASLLASIFYFGTFFGSIISGKLSDQHGRKPLTLIGSILQLIMGTMFIFVNTYQQMIFARFMYGFSFGFSISLTTTMFAQISPIKYRGKGILFINFCVSFGKLYAVILAYFFLQSFTKGNWRWMMVLSCLPNVLVLIGGIWYLKETPRYLVANNKIEAACGVLERFGEQNKTMYRVSQEQKQQLQKLYRQVFEDREVAELKSLFNKEYAKVTTCLVICWLSINFMYFGQLVVLPFIFGKQDKSFASYFITILGEMPNLILSIYLIDNPKFGRKKSLTIFYIISSVFHFCFSFNSLTLFSSLSRFFMKGCFQMLYPCTTQSYGTLNRALGFGFNSAVGRLGAAIMPYLIIPLVDVNIPLISILFMVVSLIGSYFAYSLPFDGTNKSLDEKKQGQGLNDRLVQLQRK